MTELFEPSDELLALDPDRMDREELTTRLQEDALARYAQREEELGEFEDGPLMRALERYLLLQIIDQRWREHLHDMDYLREGIHLRGLAQLDPLVAYKNEAYALFGDLMNLIWLDFGRMIYHVQVTVQEMPPPGYAEAPAPIPATTPSPTSSSSTGAGRVSYTGGAALMGSQALAAAAAGGAAGLAEHDDAAVASNGAPAVEQRHTDANEPGRNDPCWCGSGKKYKKCHGA
jgi:preprotein translocase subunit SecA